MHSGDHCPLCQQKDTDTVETWLQCDACNNWYHGSCLDLSCQSIDSIERFHCPACVDKKGPSTCKMMSLIIDSESSFFKTLSFF
jgi:hypothetical protein